MLLRKYFFLISCLLSLFITNDLLSQGFANCEAAELQRTHNNYCVEIQGIPDKNKVTFTLQVTDLNTGQLVSLPPLKPSSTQTPRYVYVWTFGDNTPPIRTDEPQVTHIYPASECTYLAKVEITSLKSNDDLSIASSPIDIPISPGQDPHSRNEGEPKVNMIDSEYLFIDISRAPRIGQTVTYFVTYTNPTATDLSGSILFEYPKAYRFIPESITTCNSSADDSSLLGPFEADKGREIRYDFEGLAPNVQKTIALTFQVNKAVRLGTALGCLVSMQLPSATYTSCSLKKAVSSWDPNTKEVNESVICTEDENVLIYTIYFENEGNAESEHVIIRDFISPFLDLSTLQTIEESFPTSPPQINYETREVTWHLNVINLPGNKQEDFLYNFSACQGFLTYRIELKEGAIADIPQNTSFGTSAQIVFHKQPIIATDPALTTRYCLDLDCSVEGNSTNKGFTNVFELGSVIVESGNDGGYGDFSFVGIPLLAGQTYDLNTTAALLAVNNSDPALYNRIWIDYNQNGNFQDNGEELLLNHHGIAPEIAFDVTIGTSSYDWTSGSTTQTSTPIHQNIHQTEDNGYILVGTTDSPPDGDKSAPNQGGKDIWVFKMDADGNKVWDKGFGGGLDDVVRSFCETSDGGYLIGCTSLSPIGGDKSEANIGGSDFWVVKIDANGNKVWDKTFGGNNEDHLNSIQATNDGGYLLVGSSESGISGDKSEASRGGLDFWIVKIDANGNKVWDKTFGGSSNDEALCVQVSLDGDFLVGGYSYSSISGDKTAPNYSAQDFWIVKIDANGNKVWDKTFGGDSEDSLHDIQAVIGGGYLLAGYSDSSVSGNKSASPKGGNDYWLVRIDNEGNKIWDQSYGGNDQDILNTVRETSNGHWILGGHSFSNSSADKSEDNRGGFAADYWLLKIDEQGRILWDKTIGGTASDVFSSLHISDEGGLTILGSSDSDTGADKSENSKGGLDFWMVKLSDDDVETDTELTTSNSFTVPITAKAGITAIRIATGYDTAPEVCQDLANGEIEDYTVRITPHLPDLVVKDVNNIEESNTWVLGEEYSLEFSLKNVGTKAVELENGESSQIQLKLSTDVLWDANDMILDIESPNYSYYFESLQVEGSFLFSGKASIPESSNLQPGTYYLLIGADGTNKVEEINEYNNYQYIEVLISSPIEKPDLAFKSAELYPSIVQAAHRLRIFSFLQNLGGKAANEFSVSAYLSADEIWSIEEDIKLNTFDNQCLRSGAEVYLSELVHIPIEVQSGDYYLMWVIDANGEIEELNEGNNWVSMPITVTASAPDLLIENAFLSRDSTAVGGKVIVNHQVINRGESATGRESSVDYYLVHSACELDKGTYLGTTPIPNLTLSAPSLSLNTELTIPDFISEGTYYIRIHVDAKEYIAEAYEENNTIQKLIEVSENSCLLTDFEKLYLLETEAAENNTNNIGEIQTHFITVCGGTSSYKVEILSSNGGFLDWKQVPIGSGMQNCNKYRILDQVTTNWEVIISSENECHSDRLPISKADIVDTESPQIAGITISPETKVGASDGAIEVTVVYGNTDCDESYTYHWSGYNNFEAITDEGNIEDLASGYYDLVVSDCLGTVITLENIYISRNRRGRGRGKGADNIVPLLEGVQVFPNPFSINTNIVLNLNKSEQVQLEVYNNNGQLLKSLFKGVLEKGVPHEIIFETTDLPNGVYILQLLTNTQGLFYKKIVKY